MDVDCKPNYEVRLYYDDWYTGWEFTGRIKYVHCSVGVQVYFEIEYERVKYKSKWYQLLAPKFYCERVTRTKWMHTNHFYLQEQPQEVVYECARDT